MLFCSLESGLKLMILLSHLCATVPLSIFVLFLSFNRVSCGPDYMKQTMYSRMVLIHDCTSLVLELQACVTTPGLYSTGALTQGLLHTRHGFYYQWPASQPTVSLKKTSSKLVVCPRK